jgi:thiol-disulfide isomerase/thioredoxin
MAGSVVALATAPIRSATAQEGIALGAKAPVVRVNDLDGKAVDLGAYIGKKPVVLEFWATWCTLCEELLPRLKAAHAAFGDRVEFLGINVTVNQSPARVRRYLESHQPPYRTLYDDRGTSIRAYQVPSTSYIVIVDREGKVAYTGTGGEQNLEPVLKQVTSR